VSASCPVIASNLDVLVKFTEFSAANEPTTGNLIFSPE
jgi:hypothetical protein